MVTPGSASGNYRWGPRSSDDILASVFSRPTVSRLTTTVGALFPANYLAAMDVPLNLNATKPGDTSTMARTFGVGEIMVRNDLRWEELKGARPAQIVRQLDADPGLTQLGVYGSPGDNTTITDGPDPNPGQARADAALPPLIRYGVDSPLPIARAETTQGSVVLDGDNFAIPDLLQLGMLGTDASRPASYLLAGSTTADGLLQAIDDHGRLVVSDSNRRRLWSVHRTDNGYTATLDAGGKVSGATATSMVLFPERTETQSLLTYTNATSVTATSNARSFGISDFGPPAAAFDGDPATAWLASDIGKGAGQSLTVTFDRPRSVASLRLDFLQKVGVNVAAVRVTTDHGVIDSLVPPATIRYDDNAKPVAEQPSATVPVDPADTLHLTVEVLAVAGTGNNRVGMTEVHIIGSDGVEIPLDPVVEMPTTLDRLVSELSPEDQARVAAAPYDVVMRRQIAHGDPQDDEEATLRRAFEMPQDRTFRVYGTFTHQKVTDARITDNVDPRDATKPSPCFSIGTIDGKPLNIWVNGTRDDLLSGKGVAFGSCFNDQLSLGAGRHELITDPGWPIDVLSLSSGGDVQATTTTPPTVTVTRNSATTKTVEVSASDSPYYLVTGIGYDARWHATIDGKPLGPATVIDGYSVGWRIDQPGPHRIRLGFGPQGAMNLALLISAFGLVLIVVIGAVSYRRVRRARNG